MVLVGVLLVAGFGASAVGGGVGYRRGGYNGAFWKLPLDDKLEHVAANRREWWWVSLSQLVGIFFMSAGLAGLTYLISAAGEPVLAYVALGAYLVALVAWVFGLIAQTTTVPRAASQRAETGETPVWIHSFWDAGYLAEGVWVVGTNVAYAIIGVALLHSGLVGAWAGWLAVGLGVVIPVAVVITRYGFPEMGLFVPFIVGIAVIVETL